MGPTPIICALIGYVLGAIPFGLLLTRAFGAGDLRSIGSGNIGATNVLRTGRKGLAAATLLLDGGKGAAAVLLTRHFTGSEHIAAIAGFAAFGGHLFPVWLNFRGGKGVATMLGVSLAGWWPAGVAALLVWLIGAVVTRYSSVGGMMAAVASAVLFTVARTTVPLDATWTLTAWAMTALLMLKHGDNIRRLRAGTESKIGAKSPPGDPDPPFGHNGGPALDDTHGTR
ncbi:glycerol-3-phosphate 1-O-acyltransferase PlsY [Polymorphobacter sp. PAMC 29334]|uniref:glycerol-3-phosphate 1-O-acyltransferase PlsY n=1 Tax=Polymorphobacter sp. PAMC 29334 TaxID=2862331 RepID=UPI001C7662FF|nr:glycerol-3-phosphate 1-O-acyltransferase PlsY [Polymorphobacter sp. PAMC 29334]QYE34655.1 glycerol-3-phosphate 1-O-acyltransferase PlsY [Polymorphobacter sp. PAMC 29334]